MASPSEIRKARRLSRANEKAFKQLMLDIRNDVQRLTENSKDLDEWMAKLGSYVATNVFVNGAKVSEAAQLIADIVRAAEISSLPVGGKMELVKGVIAQNTMHYVTRMGEDMKNELRRIALDGYNQKLAPKELAKEMADKVDGMSRQRAQCIARTETMRASNMSNWANAKYNMGAQSFRVTSDPDCCPDCEEAYQDGNVVFDIDDQDELPPRHPWCRCVPRFSTKSVEEVEAGLTEEEDTE